MTIFKTNALNIDELDIASDELDAMRLQSSLRPIYIGQREFQSRQENLQRSLDRLAMFDAAAGLDPSDIEYTRWFKIQQSRYDQRLDHSTHNLWPFVGKLEPRLARACINLAVGSRETATVVDPFCGSGTVLLEANLMGLNTIGGDIDPFAYWLTQMKLSLDEQEYAKAVKRLHKHNDPLLVMQRAACPPRKCGGEVHVQPAWTLLVNLRFPVEAIVTSPPYYDALNYNDRHADIRRRLELTKPKERTLGVDQSTFEYSAEVAKISQAMAGALAQGGKVAIVSADYRGVDTPGLYETALRQSGLRFVTKLKRPYRSPVLGVGEDIILVMEKP